MNCLDVTRTFAEKFFAVCAAYAKNRAAGKARHYYDLCRLAGLQEVQTFVAGPDFATVCEDVRSFTLENWPGSALPPETGIGRCEAFNPDAEGLRELTRNFEAERDLSFASRQPSRRCWNDCEICPFQAEADNGGRRILGPKFRNDMLYIGVATVVEAEVLVSWNFLDHRGLAEG